MNLSSTIQLSTILLLFSYAKCLPFERQTELTKFEEISDMDKILRSSDDLTKTLSQHAEDETVSPILLNKIPNLKYDVEIIESGDLKRDNDGVEEHFHGAALNVDTNLFADEDIEVHKVKEAKPFSYLALITVFSIFGLIVLIIYVVLITWRHRLEQRYGQRVLLVTRCDEDDDFLRERNDDSNSNRQQIPMVNVY